MNNLNFSLPANDPLRYLVDEQVRPFVRDQRHDVTDTAAPKIATGQFVVHEHVVPADTVEVVMGVVPHVWQRTDVGDPQESVVLLPPIAVAGWVLFDVLKGGNQPYVSETNYNTALLAGSANDANRLVRRGSTFYPQDTHLAAQTGFTNPLSNILVPAKTKFQVIFSVTETSLAPPNIPSPWAIGSTAVDPSRRIDFAGAYVFGMTMPQTVYDEILRARRKGLLGPEAR